MIILGVETSCDETAASVIETKKNKIKVLSNIVSSQIKMHAKWGGVVPNLAAREHLKNILPVVETALKEAKKTSSEIDLLTVTNGPGLIPALLIGTNALKALSYVWKKPLLGIHHIEGHIYANFINENPKFPVLCLVVSGGHTQLVLMKNHLQYEIVGQTLDDAAGEAFDKVARILDIGYPGGPAVAKMAKLKIRGQLLNITLPRPMINKTNFNFSFSGLKTAVLYETKKNTKLLKNKRYLAEICHEFQQAVVDVLIHKTLKAAEKYKPKTIMLAGGVSANTELRKQLGEKIKKEFKNIHPVKSAKGGAKQFNGASYITPELKYSIDNATMIAVAGHFRWKKMTALQKKSALKNWAKIKTDANLKLCKI